MVTRRPAEESRALLIEAAAEVIRSEGYAMLSARRLAEKVGLKRQIVHYYFKTMEDLCLAMVRHYGDLGLARLHAASPVDDDALHAVWAIDENVQMTSFSVLAMTSHRPAIREVVRDYMERFKAAQTTAIARYLEHRGLELGAPPVTVAIILQSVAGTLAAEAAIGATTGHAETQAAILGWLKAQSQGGDTSRAGEASLG